MVQMARFSSALRQKKISSVPSWMILSYFGTPY